MPPDRGHDLAKQARSRFLGPVEPASLSVLMSSLASEHTLSQGQHGAAPEHVLSKSPRHAVPERARLPASEHAPEQSRRSAVPEKRGHLEASKLIDDWKDAAVREAVSAMHKDNTTWQIMKDTYFILDRMGGQVAKGICKYVMALTDCGDGAGDIQAIATVTPLGFNYDKQPLMNVGGLVATPKGIQQGPVGAQLIRRISDWAASTGHLVVTNAPQSRTYKEHYKGLGFDDVASYYMLYRGHGPEEPLPRGQSLEETLHKPMSCMVILENDSYSNRII